MYVGSCAGVYYAFDLRTGAVRWEHDFKPDPGHATFHGDPLLTDTVLVTGTESLQPARVYAFDPSTGVVRWHRADEWSLTRSDVIGMGDLAVGRNDRGDLVALDVASGELRWHVGYRGQRFRPDVAESPAAVDGDVIFSAPDGALYRADGRTGAIRWRHAVDCDVTTSVAVRGDDVYAGCHDGSVIRLAVVDGAERARLRLPATPDGRLAVLHDRAIVPGGARWIGAVDRDLTQVLWKYVPAVPLSVVQPLVWGGVVLTGTGEGRLIALDLRDGSMRWTTRLSGSIVASDVTATSCSWGRSRACCTRSARHRCGRFASQPKAMSRLR